MTVSLRGSREARDGYQLFRLTGLLDAFSEPAFRRVMVRCIEEGPAHLILDLSTIDFIDSSGLGVLVQMAKKIQGCQGSLRIVTNPRVTQTVKLVRLEQFLTLVSSIEEAEAGLLAATHALANAVAHTLAEASPLADLPAKIKRRKRRCLRPSLRLGIRLARPPIFRAWMGPRRIHRMGKKMPWLPERRHRKI
ncbi:MAG: STAS domain-containing protein [Oscillatoriales cyanobacterium SM2_1_8]|nr:STAS domain-containing protein [Oscillatoriales cyanobacterium SM2_1_8]